MLLTFLQTFITQFSLSLWGIQLVYISAAHPFVVDFLACPHTLFSHHLHKQSNHRSFNTFIFYIQLILRFARDVVQAGDEAFVKMWIAQRYFKSIAVNNAEHYLQLEHRNTVACSWFF